MEGAASLHYQDNNIFGGHRKEASAEKDIQSQPRLHYPFQGFEAN